MDKVTATETDFIMIAYVGTDPQHTGKVWGVVHKDSYAVSYDWVDVTQRDALLVSPVHVKKPSDVVSPTDPDGVKLDRDGKLVLVTRTVTITVKE